MFYTPTSQVMQEAKEKSLVYRDEYIQVFNNLINEPNNKNILMYYGIGGIGKSSILKTIEEDVQEDKNTIVIKYDFDDTSFSQLKVYESIIIKLIKSKIKIKYLPLLFAMYWKKANPNSEFKESTLPFIEEGSFVGDILSEISGESFLSLGGSGVNIVHKLYKKVEQKASFDKNILAELNDIRDFNLEGMLAQFPKFLAYDLEELEKQTANMFIFLFDTYEKLGVKKNIEADKWIKDLVFYLTLKDNAPLKKKCFFIFAGREGLGWDINWQPYLTNYEISSLSVSEIKLMLKNSKISDEKFAISLIELSKGQPFYIDLAIALYKKEPNIEKLNFNSITTNEIFEKFVKYLKPEELVIIEILSIPRKFDFELYKYLLKKFEITFPDSLLQEILKYSFFKKNDEYYYMHDLMRDSIRLNLDKQNVLNIHKILYQWYKNIIDTIEYNNITESDLYNFGECLHHLLKIEEETSVIDVYKKNLEFKLEQAGKYHFLIELTNKTVESLQNNDFKMYLLIKLIIFYEKMENHKNSKEVIEALAYSEIPPTLYSYYNYALAYSKEQERKLNCDLVIKKYEKVKNAPLEIKILSLIGLGNTHRKNKNLVSAKKNLNEAYQLSKKNDSIYLEDIYDKLHFVYKEEKNFDLALDYALKALEERYIKLHKKHLYIGKSYRNISNLLFTNKNYLLQTKSYIMKSLEIYKYYYDSVNTEITNLYQKLVVVLDRLNMLDKFLDDIPIYIDIVGIKIALVKKGLLQEKDFRVYCDENPEDRKNILMQYAYTLYFNDKKKAISIYQELLLNTDNILEKAKLLFLCAKLSEKEFSKAEKYYLQYLDKIQELGNLDNLFKANTFLYAFYYSNKKYAETQKYAQKQLDISKQITYDKKYMYRAYMSLQTSIKYDSIEKEQYLWKLFEIAQEMDSISKSLDSLKNLFYYYKNTKNIQKQLEILEIQESYLKDKNLMAYLDITYGKKAELYKQERDYDNVELYYDKQLELREKRLDYVKLAKGYLFKAELYPVKDSRYKYYLDRGLEILNEQDAKDEIYKCLLIYLHNCVRTDEDKFKYIVARYKLAQELKNKNLILKSLKELINFYDAKKEDENFIKYSYEKIKLLEKDDSYIQEYSQALKKIIVYHINNNDLDVVFQLQTKRLHAELKLMNTENIDILLHSIQKYYLEQNVILMYKTTIGNYFSEQKIKEIIPLIEGYCKYVYTLENRKEIGVFWSYLKKQMERIYKYNRSIQVRSFNYLLKIDNKSLNSFIYDYKVESHLLYNRKNYGKQDEILNNAVIYFENNNKKLYIKYKDKYENYKERISKLYIVNGEILYQKLQPIIESTENINFNDPLKVFEMLKGIFNKIANDSNFYDYLSEKGLEFTYITQILKTKIDNFNEIQYGFDSLSDLFRFIVVGTNLKVIKLQLDSKIKYRLAFNTNEKYESLENIQDYAKYVHTTTNYAKLISKSYFQGDGVFIPKNRDILFEVIDIIIKNEFIIKEITIVELQNICNEQVSLYDHKEIIILNILYSLYYANAFDINIDLRKIEEQKLTLKYKTVKELIQLLSLYGKEKLLDLSLDGEFIDIFYDMLWVKKTLL